MARILVADDERIWFDTLRPLLEDDRHDVGYARDVPEARTSIENAEQGGFPIDVVVLDVMMGYRPEEEYARQGWSVVGASDEGAIAGVLFLEEIHSRWPRIRPLLYTVYSKEEVADRIGAKRIAGCRFVQKTGLGDASELSSAQTVRNEVAALLGAATQT